MYRLITQETIEEKIMSLQNFKKNLARSLIQSQGSNLSVEDVEKMQVGDLLGCFEEHTAFEKE